MKSVGIIFGAISLFSVIVGICYIKKTMNKLLLFIYLLALELGLR